MRIKVIIPNSSQQFLQSQVEIRRAALGEGIEVDVDCLKYGPLSLESGFDEALVSPHLIYEVQKAQDEGYDAITIDCAADPAMRAVKEVADIPVVSAGEASYLFAMALCKRFSVITVLENTADVIKDNISKYDLSARVASVRAANVPVLDLQDHDKAFKAIKSEAERAIKEDHAEAIVLGCTGMSALAAYLQEELKVPVIDPAVSALQLAAGLVQMNLSPSKICFKNPPKK